MRPFVTFIVFAPPFDGDRGVVATLQQIQDYCCWFCVEVHVTEFVKQCIHCMDSKTGEKIP